MAERRSCSNQEKSLTFTLFGVVRRCRPYPRDGCNSLSTMFCFTAGLIESVVAGSGGPPPYFISFDGDGRTVRGSTCLAITSATRSVHGNRPDVCVVWFTVRSCLWHQHHLAVPRIRQ